MGFGSNEDVASAPLLTLYGEIIEESYKQEIVTNIEFEAIVTSIKKYFFHQHMVYSMNKLELSDKEYQTNGNVKDEKYKGKFLFTITKFVSFVIDLQSMYFMST